MQLYRDMTPQERINIAAQLYEDGIAITRSSILARRPDISPEELEREIRRRLLSRQLFEQVERYRQERKADGAV